MSLWMSARVHPLTRQSLPNCGIPVKVRAASLLRSSVRRLQNGRFNCWMFCWSCSGFHGKLTKKRDAEPNLGVIFDGPFPGGHSLNGACDDGRGYYCYGEKAVKMHLVRRSPTFEVVVQKPSGRKWGTEAGSNYCAHKVRFSSRKYRCRSGRLWASSNNTACSLNFQLDCEKRNGGSIPVLHFRDGYARFRKRC